MAGSGRREWCGRRQRRLQGAGGLRGGAQGARREDRSARERDCGDGYDRVERRKAAQRDERAAALGRRAARELRAANGGRAEREGRQGAAR